MTVRIAIIIEGETEVVFMPKLREFLKSYLSTMPKLDSVPSDGRIPTKDKLKHQVRNLFNDKKNPADYVIVLTDVYTGTNEFRDAQEAKAKMREWVGDENRFFPHVALYDFEAWLLPYWIDIQKLAGSNRTLPSPQPEHINHGKPPSFWLKEVFRNGSKGKSYVKTRDAGRILRDKNLMEAAQVCGELKAFLSTLLELSGLPKEKCDDLFLPYINRKHR